MEATSRQSIRRRGLVHTGFNELRCKTWSQRDGGPDGGPMGRAQVRVGRDRLGACLGCRLGRQKRRSHVLWGPLLVRTV